MSSISSTPIHRITRNKSKQMSKQFSLRRQSSFYLEDKFLSNSNFDSQSTAVSFDDDNLFSEGGFESETQSFETINQIKLQQKKINKQKIQTKKTIDGFNIPQKKAIKNIKTMRFQQNTRDLKKKTYRVFCYDDQDLNIKQEFLDLDIPHYQSDNDKQSDDSTIRHAIKHQLRSLNEAIEEEKQCQNKDQEDNNDSQTEETNKQQDEDKKEEENIKNNKQTTQEENSQRLTRQKSKQIQNQ